MPMATVAGSTPPTPSSRLPQGIPPKPKPEDFAPPVAWLFGRQYIATLKWILVYIAFKGKLDHRDWMKAEIIPPDNSPTEIDKFWRQATEDWAEPQDGDSQSEKEFWFDYISDTGDGQKAVYSIAYLCLSDFALDENLRLNDAVEFVSESEAAKLKAEGKVLLPRGTFLFVGGDTSYHISDYATLANRFQNPFWWAFSDLYGQARSVMGKLPRLLFGIPGNHDYYDSLDGFNRQFRKPSTEDKAVDGGRRPLLMLPTFIREQEASYLALRLPFDWWFWGLDTEKGEIDFRQQEFFKEIQATYAPKKLILATPEPTTAFGKFAEEDDNQSKTFKALGLERPFLKNAEPIAEGKCRVDLSGDIHHYARYWGAAPASQSASNYASVMSGGGGAFFHPSQTNLREVEQQVLYPPADASRQEVANQLFKFRNIWSGGWVWLFGFLIAFSIFFAATFPQSSKDAIDSFPLSVALGISPPLAQQMQETIPAYVKPMPRYMWGDIPPNYYLWMIALGLSVILLGASLVYSSKLFKKEYDPTWSKKPKEVTRGQRISLWALIFISFGSLALGLWGFHYNEGQLTRFSRSLIILIALGWSALAVIESLWYSKRLFEETSHADEKSYRRSRRWWRNWPLWALLIMCVLGFGSSLWLFGKHESAYLISDLILLLILLLVGGGLTYFGYATGGHFKKGIGKIGFLLLGASHALLQLAVPFLLIRRGHLLWAPLATLVLAIIFKYVGRQLAKFENGWPLALAWIVFGAALLVIPFVFHADSLNLPDNRWLQLLLCFYAGAIGAVISCVLFGGYLAVSLAFDGHNNEAGGAARIEGFKQFIRFRLNRDGLTGYVIGIDKAEADGSMLRPKIVDIFHIRE
jgi:hypothetical protein